MSIRDLLGLPTIVFVTPVPMGEPFTVTPADAAGLVEGITPDDVRADIELERAAYVPDQVEREAIAKLDVALARRRGMGK